MLDGMSSLRKFVVTNRLLSRRDSGYQMNTKNFNKVIFNLYQTNLHQKIFYLYDSPIKGMNAATTLYWQIPLQIHMIQINFFALD
jgi:nitrous oxidase accessory protein NosD